jgi:hypothetical protein
VGPTRGVRALASFRSLGDGPVSPATPETPRVGSGVGYVEIIIATREVKIKVRFGLSRVPG